MIAYKIVINFDGIRASAFVGGRAEVIYEPGQWAEAPKWLASAGYHLTVFIDRQEALRWLEAVPDHRLELWEVEVEGLIQDVPQMMTLSGLEEGRLIPTGLPFPNGTAMARRVKLVRRIA